MFPHRRQPSSSPAPRRARAGRTARTSRSQPARRARLLTRRAKLNAARRPRRGVLLLVVLSLLVLFMMVGTAFIITAKQSQKTANAVMKSSARLASEAAQTQLLDEVLHQVLRDTNNPNSSLRFHSLLGDMYGNDGIKTRVIVGGATVAQDSTGTDVTRAQMLDLQLDQTYVKNFQNIDIDGYGNYFNVATAPPPPNTPPRFSPYDNAYGGQVLTFLSGPAKGRSTRIVGFVPPNRIRVMNVQLENGALIDPATLTRIGNEQSRILINGRPFSGTGFGYNRAAAAGDPKLSLREEVGGTRFPLALLPNAKFLNVNAVYTSTSATETTPNPEHLINGAGIAYLGANYTGPQLLARRTELANQFGPAGMGGANEGYDVADFQNMALAYVPATKLAETLLPGSTIAAPLPVALTIPSIGSLVIPSWHRPDLLNYWALQSPTFVPNGVTDLMQSSLGGQAMMLRKVLMRPNWLDHPKFTGSNPELSATASGAAGFQQKLARMIYGPWDVDNDNDGIRDSVWIDVGLPVMAGPNGKLVKPLVAMLIVDQESKANINASGSCDLASVWSGTPNQAGVTDVAGTGTMLATGIWSKATPRGVGYGPADVSLEWIVGPNDFRRLLVGDTLNGNYVPGRYGHPDTGTGLIRPGTSNTVDLLAQVQFFGWPRSANARSNFGSPSDLRARYGSGVNYYGQPAFDATLTAEMTNANASLLIDSPYEINLSQGTAAGMQGYGGTNPRASDAIFADAELERVLRLYDADAGSLPPRLAALSGLATDLSVRNKITTTSFDLPVPSISLPHEIAEDPQMWSTNLSYRRLPKSAAEIIEMRVRKGLGVPAFPEPLSPTQALEVREALRQLVAPELATGGRINVNRSFGNGFDDNGNGVVDEPGEEAAGSSSIWNADPTLRPTAASTAGFNAIFPAAVKTFMVSDATDPLNPVYAAGDPIDHRQLLARHLYVTALTMAAEKSFGDGSAPDDDQKLAQRIAQWAINVVDYRDPDNIMTPFEYDINPFDGWDIDGQLGKAGPDGIIGTADDTTADSADDSASHRGLVWGAERPELIMTETLAWHDRNTTDEADDDPNPGEQAADTNDPVNPDPDFDQLYRPRGAFFMELTNPWPATVAPSRDLHRTDTEAPGQTPQDLGVDVAKTHNGAPTGSPVWRVIVTRDINPTKDPDDPKNKPASIDRSIYLTTSDPNLPDDGEAFYNHPDDPVVPPVRPGRYMVVGSGTPDENRPKVFVSQLGQRLDQRPSDRPRKPLRRIELDTNGVAHPVRLIDNMTSDNSVAENGQGGGTPYAMEAPSELEAQGLSEMPQPAINNGLSVTDVAVINGHAGQRRRFTLSEPAKGYVGDPGQPVGNVEFVRFPHATGNSYDPSEEGQYCFGGDPNRPKAIDTPLDDADPELQRLGTDFSRGRRLFLQRLANPLLPHDAMSNPYLTIDDTNAYITVFNGRLSASQSDNGKRNTEVRGGFSSVERGYGARGLQADRDLWKTRAPDTQRNAEQDPTRAAINVDTKYSMTRIPQATLGFLNRPYLNQAENDPVRRRLLPEQPFPWLTWNNRPFISGNELMMVPRHRSSQMLRYFRSAEKPANPPRPYEPTEPDDPQQQFANPNFQPKPFSHLENFFSSEVSGTAQPGVPLHLYRMLDLIETPSLFAGTETWLNPSHFQVGAPTAVNSPADPRAQLLAPFNRVSEFRDPGLININTVSERDSQNVDKNVWDSMFHGRADRKGTAVGRVHPGPSLEDWGKSRRGYGAAATPVTLLSEKFPTVFANPLRPADAGDWVPTAEMVRAGVDVTLLRSVDGKSGADATAGADPAPSGDPLFTADLTGATNDHRNSERNGFFRYQPMVRLDNLVTSRSNVYAVWITVGFFEVEEVPEWGSAGVNPANFNNDPQLYKKVYPEGYTFTREDGVDVGNVRRLRGFYIIDRTKMAGFEPGADHNVNETIRLRRRIE